MSDNGIVGAPYTPVSVILDSVCAVPCLGTQGTLLSLERYAQIMGLDPLRFRGGVSQVRPAQGGCNDIWFEEDYQGGADKISRAQLQDAIASAERDLADNINYWPGPLWIEDEHIPWPKTRVQDYSYPLPIYAKTLTTRYGYVLAGGRRAAIALGASLRGPDIDADGDGYAEWAQFTLDVTVDIDICGVHAYYKPWHPLDADNTRTDPASAGADRLWEIRGLKCVLNGPILTVYVPRWGLFRPQLWSGLSAEAIDADEATHYVDTVEFYYEYNDPANALTLVWADGTTADTTFRVVDQRRGFIQIIPTCACQSAFEPAYARVWYRAGYVPQGTHGWYDGLDNFWATNIAILATARLFTPLCTCQSVQAKVDAWQANMVEQGQAQAFQIDPQFAKNPLGSRVGEVWVWQRIQSGGRKIGRAIKV